MIITDFAQQLIAGGKLLHQIGATCSHTLPPMSLLS